MVLIYAPIKVANTSLKAKVTEAQKLRIQDVIQFLDKTNYSRFTLTQIVPLHVCCMFSPVLRSSSGMSMKKCCN